MHIRVTRWLNLISGNAEHAVPDNKDHGANMGPTWVLYAPDGPHVGPTNFDFQGWSSLTS